MKLSTRVILILVASLVGLTGQAFGDVASLRGMENIPETKAAPMELDFKEDKENIPRTFEQQPPLVPHLNEKYTINLKQNKCLDCHMKQPGKAAAKSVEIPESHYVDRNGKRLDHPAGSRHFCTQCHVPQADAQPLVGSSFQALPMSSR